MSLILLLYNTLLNFLRFSAHQFDRLDRWTLPKQIEEVTVLLCLGICRSDLIDGTLYHWSERYGD